MRLFFTIIGLFTLSLGLLMFEDFVTSEWYVYLLIVFGVSDLVVLIFSNSLKNID